MPAAQAAAPRCLSECTPRIGIVSAFGAGGRHPGRARRAASAAGSINGNRFTTGTLRGNRVVIVLSGVSMINATMVTQLMIDHFRVERLVMSGIAGGINPAHHVGDVIVPERWAMPMEVYWNHDAQLPAPCGTAGDVSCLGLQLHRGADGKPMPSFKLPGEVRDGPVHARDLRDERRRTRPKGEFRVRLRGRPGDAGGRADASRRRSSAAGRRREASASAAPDPKLCVSDAAASVVVGGRGVVGARCSSPTRTTAATCSNNCRSQAFEMEDRGARARRLRERHSLHRVPQPERPGRRRGIQRRRRRAVRERAGRGERVCRDARLPAGLGANIHRRRRRAPQQRQHDDARDVLEDGIVRGLLLAAVFMRRPARRQVPAGCAARAEGADHHDVRARSAALDRAVEAGRRRLPVRGPAAGAARRCAAMPTTCAC